MPRHRPSADGRGSVRGVQEGALEESDWQHALAGRHLVLELDGRLAGHASVAERTLEVDGRLVTSGRI